MTTQQATISALEQFVNQWLQLHQKRPTVIYDSKWPSSCHQNQPGTDGEPCLWQPVPQHPATDMFQRLSAALEVEVHPSLEAYFTQFWADPLLATAPDGDLVLLQVWNEEDMERLRANLVGHALAKHKQKRPLTFFFACTEPDDGILSVMNDDGSIWFEYPGKPPVRKVADNLPEFLSTLTPRAHN